ncbi:hypothetical protein AN219_09580 [Streptomyces nanshensis]|nr:hypothetical protein AN219_09580 [Streptomyces nanshensis]
MHRAVQRQGGGAAPGALAGACEPVAQLLALRLLAAAAHQSGRQQRFRLPVHLQTHPRHPREQPRLYAQQSVVDERFGVRHQALPVLGEVSAARVEEPHLRVGLHGGTVRERPVQLGDVPSVQPVRRVRQQQITVALQHRLHPPPQPVPGVEVTGVPGALFAEAAAVLVHAQQRRGGVGAQRVQPQPAVGHAGVEPHRRVELLLGLGVLADGVGVHAPQPGKVGRGVQMRAALRAVIHHVPHETSPVIRRRPARSVPGPPAPEPRRLGSRMRCGTNVRTPGGN